MGLTLCTCGNRGNGAQDTATSEMDVPSSERGSPQHEGAASGHAGTLGLSGLASLPGGGRATRGGPAVLSGA